VNTAIVVLGAVVALAAAALAALVSTIGVSKTVAAGIAAGLALLAAASDLHVLGFGPPFFQRQVNETWLPKYRSWLYGLGFGWQIGAGLTTYIMTTAVLLTIALGALTASPLAGFAIGVLFGTTRGLAVLLAAKIDTPAALASFHRRFDALGPKVLGAVVFVQVCVATAAAGIAWGLGAAAIVLSACGAAFALIFRGSSTRSVLSSYQRAENPSGQLAGRT
jgi:hypothetical protein